MSDFRTDIAVSGWIHAQLLQLQATPFSAQHLGLYASLLHSMISAPCVCLYLLTEDKRFIAREILLQGRIKPASVYLPKVSEFIQQYSAACAAVSAEGIRIADLLQIPMTCERCGAQFFAGIRVSGSSWSYLEWQYPKKYSFF